MLLLKEGKVDTFSGYLNGCPADTWRDTWGDVVTLVDPEPAPQSLADRSRRRSSPLGVIYGEFVEPKEAEWRIPLAGAVGNWLTLFNLLLARGVLVQLSTEYSEEMLCNPTLMHFGIGWQGSIHRDS